MSVQNIECQIAQGQIGRYLTGGALSPEALDQLEGHIGECKACTEFLSERRMGLQAMLGDRAAVRAPGDSKPLVPEPDPAPTANLVGRLREQLLRAATAPPPQREGAPEGRSMAKPLLLSGALALVLVAMTILSKNPTLIFGEKASAPIASALTPSASRAAPTAAKPPESVHNASAPAKPTPSRTPEKSPTPSPKQLNASTSPASKKVVPPQPTRRTRPKPAASARPTNELKAPPPKPQSGTIRVYDANGKLILPRS